MGEVDERIAAPRKQTPRLKVPRGSVGIAGKQTGVYSLESPADGRSSGELTNQCSFRTPKTELPAAGRHGQIYSSTVSILIQKPGILTTVQDLGRRRYRRFGINPGGVMDTAAARLANIVVCNDDNAALLEMHFPAPQIRSESGCDRHCLRCKSVTAADGEPVDNWRPFLAAQGSTLRFKNKVSGNRAYLAVRGGFIIPDWLGSASTNLTAGLGGFTGRKLAVGDRIHSKQK
jgi:hypothetical protein